MKTFVWLIKSIFYTDSFQNRTDLSVVPQVTKTDSTGECSIHRGTPLWVEGHFATFSAVLASHVTTSLFPSSMEITNSSVSLKIACVNHNNEDRLK